MIPFSFFLLISQKLPTNLFQNEIFIWIHKDESALNERVKKAIH